ncbi:hypothetical protein M885DRAFT_110896 [Pelagophyceae sp. CCMP2097]|nr:hypothetical protein M885DRAFT_110896 [Pelagophyceae sp. CCMP2097]
MAPPGAGGAQMAQRIDSRSYADVASTASSMGVAPPPAPLRSSVEIWTESRCAVGRRYFRFARKATVAALVTVYDEDAACVQKTISSLQPHLDSGAMALVVVIDGAAVMHASVRTWIRATFGAEAAVDDAAFGRSGQTAVMTAGGGAVSLVLKRTNRR